MELKTTNTPIVDSTINNNEIDVQQQETSEHVNTDITETPTANEPIAGLTTTEIKDHNQIQITISDTTTPIVVLFGPGKCGKTMTQIRLARFLQENGYSINPIRDFRPAYDDNYQNMCNQYSTFVNNEDAASSTDMLSFMLLEVLDSRGNRICQILEAPGEHYHSIQNPDGMFPAYINQLIASRSRKIWAITLEPNWIPKANCQQYNLAQYVAKVKTLKTKINSKDKVVFLYNKIDATNLMIDQTHVNKKMMLKEIADHFTGIFEPFKNTNPITSLWRPYNCDLLPFSTGTFNTYKVGTETKTKYSVGSSVFPAALWATIIKYIRG